MTEGIARYWLLSEGFEENNVLYMEKSLFNQCNWKGKKRQIFCNEQKKNGKLGVK